MVRALSALVLVALALPAHGASELPRRIGMYPQQGPALAMLDSDISVRVRGPIIEATVTQTFRNDTDQVIEATYIFPLPYDAAVSAMEIRTGNRTLRAAIEARDKAVARYEAAVSAGIGAGLLEQERPDVFTQTVSAIPARGTVTVTLRFDTVAQYQRGTWELVLPLVVAPRYVPGSASGRPTTGAGKSADTDRASDASRVTPGGAPGAGGRTDVRIELADSVEGVTSPTHELTAANGAYTTFDPKTDRDAIIRWRTKATAQGWVESSDDGGYAAVVVEAKPPAARKGELEVRIVLGRAGTTRGDAEAVQRSLMRALLGALQSRDRVAVTGSDTLAAVAPDAMLRELDDAWRKTPAPFDLTAALAKLRKGQGAFVLVTDGLVADDRPVLAAAAKVGAPIHVIAIGPAPNRGLLVQLAQVTGGTVRFAVIGDDFDLLARDVVADIASPPEPLTIAWGTLGATDVVPAKLPRIGTGQALLVVARVKKVQTANARVRGDVFGFVQVTPDKPPAGATSTRGSLARRWAKLKLDELVAAGATKQIAAHALRHGLVSPATAMVAIGDEVVVEGGVKHTVSVPVSVPAGMQWQLVKEQTTLHLDKTKQGDLARTNDQIKAKDKTTKTTPVARDDDDARKAGGEDDGEDESDSKPELDAYDPSPPPAPTSVAAGGLESADYEDEESQEISSYRTSRRAYRLALSLGAGLSVASGESAPLAALGARAEFGRRTLVGIDASLWFVDGFNAEGGVLATVARRGIARRFELGAGTGLRFTGDALGPAIALVLRASLPLRGLGLYFRYDGALLRQDNSFTGQNAGSLGLEKRW